MPLIYASSGFPKRSVLLPIVPRAGRNESLSDSWLTGNQNQFDCDVFARDSENYNCSFEEMIFTDHIHVWIQNTPFVAVVIFTWKHEASTLSEWLQASVQPSWWRWWWWDRYQVGFQWDDTESWTSAWRRGKYKSNHDHSNEWYHHHNDNIINNNDKKSRLLTNAPYHAIIEINTRWDTGICQCGHRTTGDVLCHHYYYYQHS